MAKKPLNPDSVKGGGMPSLGRSSQSASAAANKRAGAGKTMADQFAEQMKKFQAQRPIKGSAISDYWKVTRSYGTVNSEGLKKLNSMPSNSSGIGKLDPWGFSKRNLPKRGR